MTSTKWSATDWPLLKTGLASIFHDALEIAIIAVAQHFSDFPAGPGFVTGGVHAADGLEGRWAAGGEFLGHGLILYPLLMRCRPGSSGI